MKQKTCYVCKKSFPATKKFFNSDKSRTDNLHPYCKECRKAIRKDAYKNSPDKQGKAQNRASKWFKENRERARQSGKNLYRRNREERIQYSADWRKKNPEKYAKHNKNKWSKYSDEQKEKHLAHTRNRRAKIFQAEGTHTAQDIQDILEHQGGLCYYCGIILEAYHVDHYFPISKGGSNSKENLVVACPHCNLSKNDKLPEDYLNETN
jgi:hypothetical protein